MSAAKLFLFSSPTTKDLRIFVSDARLYQLQHWLQLLIKLLAVRARNAETRLLSNRPFRPCCLMIWCIRKLLLTNQMHSTEDIHSQHLVSEWCCLWRDEAGGRKITGEFFLSFPLSYLISINRGKKIWTRREKNLLDVPTLIFHYLIKYAHFTEIYT